MTSEEGRKVSRQDIQLVQNLIERCLQLYMDQNEVISTLLHQAKVEPDFTELVWQKLEEQNQEFFKAYHLRLVVKDQISRFNKLLERQVELMQQLCQTEIASIPMSNGSQIPSMNQNIVCHAPEHTVAPCKTETMQQDISTNLPHTYNNGASLLPSCMPTAIDLLNHVRRVDVPQHMLLSQNLNVGMIQGMNGVVIKSEGSYASNTPFLFGPNGNVLDAPAVGDTSLSSHHNTESNGQPVNETILDPDNSSFGFLGHIPRNFSLSDLTADFSNSSDIILGRYSRSPFLAADPPNFPDPHRGGEHQGSIAL
ncbi:hypothetical protein ACH5RR_003036 [Cinchona calisaya]|uniref:Uncharacterized protein n=1 Tax=Cinchona calisaya TaxID=153742 RepID=A0ABD3ATT3_9GENT